MDFYHFCGKNILRKILALYKSNYFSVSLVGGDLISHGILYATQEFDNGPVCAEDFDQVDAGKILFSLCPLMLP